MLVYIVSQKYMDIIILLIIAITSLSFGYISSKPINNSLGFDISVSQRSYQTKIDEYLNRKYNTKKIPTFNTYLVKTGETLTKARNFTNVRKSIKWTTKPVPEYRAKKTYIFNGYFRFKNSGAYVHRWIMEKHLNRKLTQEEVVHHIDGNKLNNNINNLMLFSSQEEHNRYHEECKSRYGTWYAYIPNYNYVR